MMRLITQLPLTMLASLLTPEMLARGPVQILITSFSPDGPQIYLPKLWFFAEFDTCTNDILSFMVSLRSSTGLARRYRAWRVTEFFVLLCRGTRKNELL